MYEITVITRVPESRAARLEAILLSNTSTLAMLVESDVIEREVKRFTWRKKETAEIVVIASYTLILGAVIRDYVAERFEETVASNLRKLGASGVVVRALVPAAARGPAPTPTKGAAHGA